MMRRCGWFGKFALLLALVFIACTSCTQRRDPLVGYLAALHAGMTVQDVKEVVPASYIVREYKYEYEVALVDRAFQTNGMLGWTIELAWSPGVVSGNRAFIHFAVDGTIAGFSYGGSGTTSPFRDEGKNIRIGILGKNHVSTSDKSTP